jgi:hypothetical protein
MTAVALFSWLALAASGPVETKFAQVAPRPEVPGTITRSPDRHRAVILVTGLYLHLIRESAILHAHFVSWQKPGSYLVSLLAADADVFAFAFAQSVPVTEIARLPDFAAAVARLRAAGYAEIVLVSHSAGGLVVRQFVEENPEAGVTKVVQVSAPNTGSGWAELVDAVRTIQKPFIDSLRKCTRASWETQHGGKPLPEHVQFVCVVGTGFGVGDGVVSVASQWPADLQDQGVPAVVIPLGHGGVVFGRKGDRIIARVVREDQPRWSPEQVEVQRRLLRPWVDEPWRLPR